MPPVLLGHTLDDQAETVLLGLGRGSGARSIAGMRPYDPPWCRPLLDVRRALTHAGMRGAADRRRGTTRTTPTAGTPAPGCAPRCCRCSRTCWAAVSPRRSPAPRPRCARTPTPSTSWREWALAAASTGDGLDAGRLTVLPEAVRRRVIRGWLLAGGASDLTDKQIRGVDALVTAWRGQGGVAVGSPLRSQRLIAGRRDGMLTLHREPV